MVNKKICSSTYFGHNYNSNIINALRTASSTPTDPRRRRGTLRNPIRTTRQRRAHGVQTHLLPMRFEDALLRRPRERSRLQLTPDRVGGTRTDADAPRSAAAEALLLSIYGGTALRCISPSPLYPRTRCPGLTENGSALRTAPPLSRSSASLT